MGIVFWLIKWTLIASAVAAGVHSIAQRPMTMSGGSRRDGDDYERPETFIDGPAPSSIDNDPWWKHNILFGRHSFLRSRTRQDDEDDDDDDDDEKNRPYFDRS